MSRAVVLSAVATALAACAPEWKPAFNETARSGSLDDLKIAPLDEALTFARTDAKERRVIAVTGYQHAMVEAVDLSAALKTDADAISLFNEHGYERLRELIATADPSLRVSVPVSELGLPVGLQDHNIAIGTNFPEHAGDAGTVRPFLFPKLVRPTRIGTTVSAGNGLLDYEVEVALVPLQPIARGKTPSQFGLIVCNDFTDRELLMHGIDPSDIESGKGFTTGKSIPGYLPVGNLFVIPRDVRAFLENLELRLYVNDALRQRSPAREMIWNIDKILAETWAHSGVRWQHRAKPVALMEDEDVIPARTLILTGTPHGTVFDGMPTRYKAEGVLRWVLGGWGKSIPDQVIGAYVDGARAARVYLQPKDRVTIHVDHLGLLQNEVSR